MYYGYTVNMILIKNVKRVKSIKNKSKKCIVIKIHSRYLILYNYCTFQIHFKHF